MRVDDPRNIIDVIAQPERAEFIAWAEAAPERCLIVTDRDFRYEGFASTFEFIEWLRMVCPEKAEILASAIDLAATEWEAKYQRKIPPARRK